MSSIEATSIGKSGEPRAPYLQGIHDKDVYLTPSGLNKIRRRGTQDISGTDLALRLKTREVTNENTSPSRDKFFSKYARVALEERGEPLNTPDSHAFSYPGFTERIAANMGTSYDELNKLLRAERINLIYESPSMPENVSSSFRLAICDFLFEFGERRGKRATPAAERIKQAWNGDVASFYKALLKEGRPTIAAWAPNEALPLLNHHEWRKTNRSPLTPFDRMVLNTTAQNTGDRQLARAVQIDTGIDLIGASGKEIVGNRGVLEMHRRLLTSDASIQIAA